MTDVRKNNKNISLPISIGIGCFVSVVMMLLGTMAIAMLLDGQAMGTEKIDYGVMIVTALSSIAGCFAAKKAAGKNILLVCMVTGVCYFLVLLSCNVLFFGGAFRAVFVTGVLILGSCACVSLLGLTQKRTRGSKRKKYRNR